MGEQAGSKASEGSPVLPYQRRREMVQVGEYDSVELAERVAGRLRQAGMAVLVDATKGGMIGRRRPSVWVPTGDVARALVLMEERGPWAGQAPGVGQVPEPDEPAMEDAEASGCVRSLLLMLVAFVLVLMLASRHQPPSPAEFTVVAAVLGIFAWAAVSRRR